jgi:23S rRNA (pseudouridine1915-N3)-methyltransferase
VRLTLLAVGKLRPAYRAAADDYLRRLRRHLTLDEVEVREVGLEGEAARLEARIPPGADVVVLDRQGQPLSSEALADTLQAWQRAARPVACLIGGSHGLAPRLLQTAGLRWSLGPLTLPHELARVVVLEQLYRAGTILRGEPYHK